MRFPPGITTLWGVAPGPSMNDGPKPGTTMASENGRLVLMCIRRIRAVCRGIPRASAVPRASIRVSDIAPGGSCTMSGRPRVTGGAIGPDCIAHEGAGAGVGGLVWGAVCRGAGSGVASLLATRCSGGQCSSCPARHRRVARSNVRVTCRRVCVCTLGSVPACGALAPQADTNTNVIRMRMNLVT